MVFRWKQGIVAGIFFAIGGFFIGHPAYTDWEFFMFPGCLLAQFLEKVRLIELLGGCSLPGYVIIANATMYGIVGFIIGALIKSRRYVFISVAILWVFVLLGYGSLQRPKVRLWWSNYKIRQTRERLRIDPNDVSALYRMGHYYSTTQRSFEAAEYYRRIVDLQADTGKLAYEVQASLLYLAIFHRSKREYSVAEEYYRRFWESEPDLERYQVLRHNNIFYLNQRASSEKSEVVD